VAGLDWGYAVAAPLAAWYIRQGQPIERIEDDLALFALGYLAKAVAMSPWDADSIDMIFDAALGKKVDEKDAKPAGT